MAEILAPAGVASSFNLVAMHEGSGVKISYEHAARQRETAREDYTWIAGRKRTSKVDRLIASIRRRKLTILLNVIGRSRIAHLHGSVYHDEAKSVKLHRGLPLSIRLQVDGRLTIVGCCIHRDRIGRRSWERNVASRLFLLRDLRLEIQLSAKEMTCVRRARRQFSISSFFAAGWGVLASR